AAANRACRPCERSLDATTARYGDRLIRDRGVSRARAETSTHYGYHLLNAYAKPALGNRSLSHNVVQAHIDVSWQASIAQGIARRITPCAWNNRNHHLKESDAQPARRAIHRDHSCGRKAAREDKMMSGRMGETRRSCSRLELIRICCHCSRPFLALKRP